MNNRLVMVAAWVALSGLTAGCSSGGSIGTQAGAGGLNGNAAGASGASSASSAAVPKAGVLRGLYWSWTMDYVPIINAQGYSSMQAEFRYEFRLFADNGFVFVGDPRPTLDEMKCSAGAANCRPYSIDGAMITIGDNKPATLEPSGSDWKIGGTTWNAIVDQTGAKLDATYKSAGCYLATCTTRSITFKPDGRYSIASSSQSGYANDFISSFSVGGSSSEGTYAIKETSIEITPEGGESNTAFFFRDLGNKTDTIQIADTWYDIERQAR